MTSRLTDAAVNAVISLLVGIGKFLTWLLNLRAVIVAVAILTMYWIYETRPFLPGPPPPPTRQEVQLRIDAANLNCAIIDAYDNAETRSQAVSMFFALLNLAKEKDQNLCQAYKSTLTNAAPSEEGTWRRWSVSVVRQRWFMSFMANVDDDRRAWRDEVSLLIADVVKNPGKYRDEYPWRSCVTRYIRSYELHLAHTNVDAMRSEMVWQHTDEKKAEFFCPKPKASSFWPPGGVPPLGVLFYVESS